MAKKKQGELTPRQRQSQRLMREKKARKMRQALLHKLALVVGIGMTVIVAGGSLWVWKSGTAAHSIQAAIDNAYAYTAKEGYSLQALYLDGRNRTSMADIEKALGVKKGDPILRVSLDEVRKRLEQIESVRFATVERELPGTLYVHIVEREPVALWQHEGKIALVDDNGVVMNDIDSAAYQHLPLIVGDDAPAHVGELLTLLALEPELAKRFAAAIRVGGRRWNIRLAGDIEVKLPENNPQQAWEMLLQLQQRQQLLDRDVKEIDLRVPDRLFIKLPPPPPTNKATNARDT